MVVAGVPMLFCGAQTGLVSAAGFAASGMDLISKLAACRHLCAAGADTLAFVSTRVLQNTCQHVLHDVDLARLRNFLQQADGERLCAAGVGACGLVLTPVLRNTVNTSWAISVQSDFFLLAAG